MLYIFVFYGETGAGIYAFFMGLVIDVFSGGITGLFTLLYLMIFIGLKLGSRPFHLFSPGGQIIVISLAVILKEILIIIFFRLFSLESIFSLQILLKLTLSSIFTGLIGSIVIFLLNQMDHQFKEPISKKSI
jgi:rod shape-determining protein MreD